MVLDLIGLLKQKIDRNNPVPLFIQIGRELESLIKQGSLKTGDMIPSAKHLAEELGISHLTFNKSLRRLVEQGYIVRRQRTGTFVTDAIRKSRRTIGFFYLKESEIIMLKVAEGLQGHLACQGIDMKLFGFAKRDYYDSIDLVQEVDRTGINGAVFVVMNTEGCRRNMVQLDKAGFPHICFGNQYFMGELRAPLVTGHDELAIRQALELCWAYDHRRIGHITSVRGNIDQREYVAFYEEHRASWSEDWYLELNFSGTPEQWRQRHGKYIARGYLEKNRDLTAIIVHSGVTCFDFVQQAQEIGWNIPKDLSVICLRDWPGLELLKPPITSFALPIERMAKCCSEEIVRVLEQGLPEQKNIIRLDFCLIERASVAEARSSHLQKARQVGKRLKVKTT